MAIRGQSTFAILHGIYEHSSEIHNLPATSSVKTALKALVDKQLVGKTPKGYLVSDRFFAKWLVNGER